jgi:poly-beta-1,6-N-acetyl-D-glucosamine synthase
MDGGSGSRALVLGWSLFLLFSGLAAWVLVGWPLFLAFLAKRSPKPVRKEAITPPVSFLVCVRDGGVHLEAKLNSIADLDYPAEAMEIIVASDGSSDNTEDIARAWKDKGVRLLSLPRAGKCTALSAALRAATHNIVIITDVRQALERDSVRLLVRSFADAKVGAVSGELRIRGGDSSEEANIGAYWKFETWIRNQLSEVGSMLGATGPFYAIRRPLTRDLPADILLDDMYLPLHVYFQGFRLVMEPKAVAWDYPTSLEKEFGRKVRTLGGNWQLLQHYPQLLAPTHPMWIHYLSYKLGRMLLPLFLLGALVSSLLLSSPWREAALLLQAAGYGVAFLEPVGWARQSSAPHQFPGLDFSDDDVGRRLQFAGVLS